MKKLFYLLVFLPLVVSCGGADHETVVITLAWDANSDADSDADLVGYKVFIREEDEDYDYSNPVWEVYFWDMGSFCKASPMCEVDVDKYVVAHFVVKAVNLDGMESLNSNEAVYYPPE